MCYRSRRVYRYTYGGVCIVCMLVFGQVGLAFRSIHICWVLVGVGSDMQSLGVAVGTIFDIGLSHENTFVLRIPMVLPIVAGAILAIVRGLLWNRILAIIIWNGTGVADNEEGLRGKRMSFNKPICIMPLNVTGSGAHRRTFG